MENVHPLIFLVPRLRFDCPFPSSLFQHVSVERCKIHRLRLKVLRLERRDLRPEPQTSRLQSMVSQRQAGAQGTSAAPRAGGARRARLPAVRAGLQSQDPAAAAAAAKSRQSCPTLCDPIDGSPPGFPVPGILQARTLEWVAISCSSAGK